MYKAKVQFVFEGTVIINAKDKNQVREYLRDHFGCVLSGQNPHTTLDNEIIPDWDFEVYPKEKIVFKIKKV